VITIENGIDIAATRSQVATAHFRVDAEAGLHVGLVGRLVGVKRPDLFLATAASLRRSHPHLPWHFHVIGDGPLAGPMKELANGLSLGSTVTFHGHRTDVVSCISSLDLLMLTSDHEGLPMVALEALAVGTPVVAHAVGGLVELLSGAGSRALVADQDAQLYAGAVLAFLAAPRKRDVFEFDHVIQRYSAATNASRVAQLYRELRAGGRPALTILET
jgi:glycosyltransferase involved in cell wall biosynthesis